MDSRISAEYGSGHPNRPSPAFAMMHRDTHTALEKIAASSDPLRVGFYLVPDFPMMTFAAALDPLRQANRIAGRALYKWIFLSIDGAPVHSSAGLPIPIDHAVTDMPRCDLVIVVAGLNHTKAYKPMLYRWLRDMHSRGTVLGGICAGQFLLAKAGLLEGRRCAVHWELLAAFQEEFPRSVGTNAIFAVDGPFITSSGGTVTLDMMLYLIAASKGRELADAISDQFNHPEIRQHDSSQRMPAQTRFGIRNAKLVEIVKEMESSIQNPVDLQVLARRVQLSTRQIERLFVAHLGKTPSAFYAGLRMARAHDLILQTDLPIPDVAQICGYMSASRFGRIYRAHYGMTPREVRLGGLTARRS
jgi:transcriptional regulator GlxA family with amidase domain